MAIQSQSCSQLQTKDQTLSKAAPEAKPLFQIPESPRNRTSDVIAALAERIDTEQVSLRTLTDRLGDRTFGVLLILTAAFNVIPFVSTFTGMLTVLLGLQMLFGMTHAGLPGRILDWQLPGEGVKTALLAFEPRIRAIEKFIRPRWQFSEAPIVDRINGFVIALLGLLIALPIPFTNLGPALVIIIMGLGLLERDGLVQLLAMSVGIGLMTAIYLIL